MSVVLIGTAVASAGIGVPMWHLAIAAGYVALGIFAAVTNETRWTNKLSNEERKNQLLDINEKITREMTDPINNISDVKEREHLLSQLNSTSNTLKADIESYRDIKPDEAFRDIRQKIISVQMDEKIARSVNDEFKIVLPAENKEDEKFASIVSDIADFGARIAFFDEGEARKIRPLMDEAASEKTLKDEFRLTAIRQEVKMRYGKLKEQRVLTELFKEELRGMLPLVKRARGAEALIVRMEELLSAREILRGEYMPLYKDVKILLAEQLESITDEAVAEKIGGVLGEMGYTLVGGDGQNMPAGEVNYLESPYEGYQVKVKVDKGGALSTRLVRVVGSEDEKISAGEYQRQKDIEIGRKWCKDLDAFHEKMKSEGIDFKTTLRKEPDEMPLDVIVKTDAGGRKKRTQKAGTQTKKALDK